MSVSDYLDITVEAAERQWREICARRLPDPGKNQVTFVPVETLMCAAAMLVVEYSRLGSSRMHLAGSPTPELAAIFRRPVSSIVAKMNNLDGRRSRGGKHDRAVGLELTGDGHLMTHVYRTLLVAARRAGVGSEALPDFLGLEAGGELTLLGQEELDESSVSDVVERELPEWRSRNPEQLESVTERYLLQYLRVGQHRFANGVLHNCGQECVFCGFSLLDGDRPTLLRAGHIKPWRDSDGRERLDVANGLAACPTHDAAFDAGLITVEPTSPHHRVKLSKRMTGAVAGNDAAAAYFGSIGLRAELQVASMGVAPSIDYLQWHVEHVFT